VHILQIRQLKKYFGDNRAVDGVDLDITAGEFVSLIGSNGAGKTTLVNLISAFLQPDEGEILFRGKNINTMSAADRVKSGIVRSFQLVHLFDRLSVLDNVALAIFSREGKTGKLAVFASSDSVVRQEAGEVLQLFGLENKLDVDAGDLAHGERKLLDVAVAYALKPSLLILDEPTSGVSTRDKDQIMDTISSVVRNGKITAVIIEHDMDVVFKYSDRIIAMHQGLVLADGTPDEIRKNNDVATYLLGETFSQ